MTKTIDYQDHLTLWKSRATKLIEREAAHAGGRTSPRWSNGSTTPSGTPSRATVTLPKLYINKYDREISMWQEFWDQFQTAIHENNELSKAEKFTYLKSYLVGPAARAIAGLKITERNYDDQREIRKKELDFQIRGLEAMGVVSSTYGGLLCPILLQMIPDDLALDYTRKIGTDHELKVKELIAFLQKEVESRERAMHLTKAGSHSKESQSPSQQRYKPEAASGKFRKPSLPSAAMLYASSSQTPPGCIFYDSTSHKPELCTDGTLNVRKEKLKKMGRCFICLGQRHIAKFCKTKGVLCDVCGRRHHPTMCDKGEPSETQSSAQETTEAVISSIAPHSVKTSTAKPNTVLLQTVTALAEGTRGKRKVHCLMDGGSQRSFILEKQVKALGLPVVRKETLRLQTFGSDPPVTMERNAVKLTLQNICDKEKTLVIEAVDTPQVSSAIMPVPGEQIKHQLEKRGLVSADVSGSTDQEQELSVLISADFYWKMVSGRVERLSVTLVAIETMFSWTVQGPVSMSSMSEASCMKICTEETMQVSNQLQAFWEIESLGISCKDEERAADTEAQEHFSRSVSYKERRYDVKLPWRQDKSELPDNLRVAQKSFEGLKRKLKADVTLFKGYNDVIDDYLQQGICEDVPQTKGTAGAGKNNIKYYLPHHAVIREDKATTKLRVVFDASAHENGCPSLNDCLLTGPNLNPDLLNVLVRICGKEESAGMKSCQMISHKGGSSGAWSSSSSIKSSFPGGMEQRHCKTVKHSKFCMLSATQVKWLMVQQLIFKDRQLRESP
ncbi:hypothetical protein D5F01_LYC06696 [Larimichthys crocea]|uniref:Uncharacterized protein n=1 Tax=Larimichthys crocea TaxID=215358 RepID=A0A6G0IR79_LARCR|nr:hypothetical protein D5F01_LYC06696 [Larimichthys crocea]